MTDTAATMTNTKKSSRGERPRLRGYNYQDEIEVIKPKPRAARSGVMPPETLEALRLMLVGGATDSEIGEALGIPVETLYNWRAKSPALGVFMEDAKKVFDQRIERSLAQSALGYRYDSEEIKVIDGAIHRVPIVVQVAPSNTAQIFWLKNRQPWLWRDKHDLEVSGDLQVTEVADDRKIAMQLLAILREVTPAQTIEGTTNAPEPEDVDADDGDMGRGDEPEPSPVQGRRRRVA